ncbi:hypothetical protein DENSPDRAFT_838427 [Dentipellis sp. KUC8613]|nr:hypothetical protein DENSPDRAFT_838427 [Dentipellis sp. KUC8613]
MEQKLERLFCISCKHEEQARKSAERIYIHPPHDDFSVHTLLDLDLGYAYPTAPRGATLRCRPKPRNIIARKENVALISAKRGLHKLTKRKGAYWRRGRVYFEDLDGAPLAYFAVSWPAAALGSCIGEDEDEAFCCLASGIKTESNPYVYGCFELCRNAAMKPGLLDDFGALRPGATRAVVELQSETVGEDELFDDNFADKFCVCF